MHATSSKRNQDKWYSLSVKVCKKRSQRNMQKKKKKKKSKVITFEQKVVERI